MSIRLRLTVLYSAILALTLIAFGTMLYITQSQATFDTIQSALERQALEFANRERRYPRHYDTAPAVTLLPGRWTQTRSADGMVIGRTGDLGDTSLPLSNAGLKAVQGGTPWTESAMVDSEPVLIYSAPYTLPDGTVRIVQVAASMAERTQSLQTLQFILITGGGLVIVIAFVMGWVLAGTALGPIHHITQTAQAIGAERNFSRRVQQEGPNDEVRQLAVTFNNMLTELETAYHQVEHALEAQRRFVADASHELRTPLTTLRGNIELLQRNPPIDAKERAEILADTQVEAERLIRLVNQLLTLARADAGRALRHEPVPVKPLIAEVCRQARLLAPQRTITWDNSIGSVVLADPDALKQVLLILIDNALVHTPASAKVCLSTSAVDQRVAIHVQDTGPGIAPDLLPHIFERFYRGDVSRSGGGAGLGLSIAKELAEAQGGALTVQSQVARGSVFTVMLPRAVLAKGNQER
jgi:two-component system OmpR family sensor kinase